MNQTLKWIIMVFCFAILQTSTAQNGKMSFSLKQAQDYAVEYNYTMKNSRISIDAAHQKVWETTSIGLPQLTAKISYQNIFNVPVMTLANPILKNTVSSDVYSAQHINDNIKMDYKTVSLPLGVKENITFDLTLSQLIFSGEYLVGLQASKTYLEFSQKSLIKSERDAREQIATTYYMALVVEENRKILANSYENMKKLVAEVSEMNKAGFTEETDVDQLQLAASNIKNSLNRIEKQSDLAKKLLKYQMGVDAAQDIELTESLEATVAQYNANSNQKDFDVNQNIDYDLMKTQESAALLTLKQQESKCLPTVAAFYRYERLLKEPALNFNPKNVLGISVEIPIFSSGGRYSRIAQAKIDLEKTRNTKQQVEEGLALEVEQSKIAYSTAYDNYTSEKESMVLAQKIYDKTLIKYKEGISTSMDLTQTQNQFLTAQSNYFKAINDLLTAQLKLTKLTGN